MRAVDRIIKSIRGSNSERQELHCHECQQYVQFDIDVSLNGNHVLECPNCGHEHCRVVEDGIITDIRWASRNGPTYGYSGLGGNITATTISTYDSYTAAGGTSTFLYSSWSNSTSASTG